MASAACWPIMEDQSLVATVEPSTSFQWMRGTMRTAVRYELGVLVRGVMGPHCSASYGSVRQVTELRKGCDSDVGRLRPPFIRNDLQRCKLQSY